MLLLVSGGRRRPPDHGWNEIGVRWRWFGPARAQEETANGGDEGYYRHSVGWPITPHATDHIVAHLFSYTTHPKDLPPGDMLMAPVQVAQFMAGLPQFSDLQGAHLTGRLQLPPPINFLSRREPSPLAAPVGPLHLSSSLLFHLIRGLGVDPLPLLTTTNNQTYFLRDILTHNHTR